MERRRWYPPNFVARAIANAMLGAMRAGEGEWPPETEDVCVRTCTHKNPGIGLRAQVAALWRVHGSEGMLARIRRAEHRLLAAAKLDPKLADTG